MRTDDPREYLDLEGLLDQRIDQIWAELARGEFALVEDSIKSKDWQMAYWAAGQIDLSPVGEKLKDFAYTVYRGCIDFGAKQAARGSSLTSSLTMDAVLKPMVSQLLQYIEWSATLQAQKQALALINEAKTGEIVIVKADPVRPFVSFKDDVASTLKLISSLHTNRLASWGFIAEADLLDVQEYKLSAMLDNRTSDFCRLMHGKVFRIEQARGLVEEAVRADDPASLKIIHPWPKQTKAAIEAYSKMSPAELVANKLHVPPFHPKCRTILVHTGTKHKLMKPVVQPADSLPKHVSTATTFKDIGVKISPKALDLWNDYIGHHPAEVLSVLSGYSPVDYLGTKKGTAKVGFNKGDIGLSWSSKGDTLDVTSSMKILPAESVLKITKIKVSDGSAEAVAQYLKTMLYGTVKLGKSIGATSVSMPIAKGQAKAAIALGFLPSATKWQYLRREMRGLLKTKLADDFAKESVTVQSIALELLGSKNEYALAALADLKFSDSFSDALLGAVAFPGELDILNNEIVKALQ